MRAVLASERRCWGWLSGAWEFAVKYAQERKQFGKTISELPGVSSSRLAQMATEIDRRPHVGLQQPRA